MALLFSRSADAVAAILAVLKTGAAYLPIDPALPGERIGFVLADAAPIAAVTIGALAERLTGHDVVVIDVNDPAVSTQPAPAAPAPRPEDIAYLIYTRHRDAQRRGDHPSQRDPAVGSLHAGLPDAGVGAVSLVGVRRVGGDLWCAVARRAPGGRA
ncbi:hypothetical protein MTIM_52720 [Mycobacterium timonense]|uniref:AMP-dependent synthetase/ligase domain-containing protein n=1 Tax=Mycobacterium timonense TaxID=701043 RepID=A0A7I9ZER9_9MYCO|nr:hypothetical protein MTIM_52720 [Mycobacterium timonense]